MKFRIYTTAFIACTLLSPLQVLAGVCDAYFPFDGSTTDASGNGYDGLLIAKGGEPSLTGAEYGEGKHGQALRLTGKAAVRVPLDLNPAACPQVTITAWVKFDDSPTNGFQYLVTSGRGNGPSVTREGQHLDVYGGGTRIKVNRALRSGQWLFIAGAWDFENRMMTVYWRNRPEQRAMSAGRLSDPEPDIWIGTNEDDLRWPVMAGLIDDVRIYGRLLSEGEIQSMQAGNNPAENAATGEAGDVAVSATGPGETASSSSPFTIGQMPPGDSGSAIEQAADKYALEYESEEAAIAAQQERDAAATEEAARQAAADAETQASGSTTTRTQALDEAGTNTSGYTLSSDSVPTGVSGTRGSTIEPMDLVNEPIVMISIQKAAGYSGHVAASKPIAVEITGINGGSLKANPASDDVFYTDPQITVDISPGAIGGLKVCINRLNSRATGLEVSGNDIDENGSLGNYRQAADQRVSCGDWKMLTLCASGSVASGVYAHFQKASSGPDKVVGLQLICRKVIPNE